MTFDEVLARVRELLEREERISYRALKRRFDLDDDYLEDLKEELIKAKRLARDEEGAVLVWTGAPPVSGSQSPAPSAQPSVLSTQTLDPKLQILDSSREAREAERRQLTVLFCDLVDSTALSERLDPEDLRVVVRAYQQTSAAVIDRYEGRIAQHLGDGLLVYFGYPAAHEDDAQRAVRTALGIIEAIQQLSFPTVRLPRPLQARIGIHTGLVVVGEIGSSEKREILALGETPNLAARLQGLAVPNSVIVSATTQRLVAGLFECQDLGPRTLKGLSTSPSVYRVIGESAARSHFEVAVSKGLTPLIGRDLEIGLLRERWGQAKRGEGQVVLLSGEAGIGKSRLVQALKEQVSSEGALRIEFRCSAYHQNSAFHPILGHLQRILQFVPHEEPQSRLDKLQRTLAVYHFPRADTFPLLAALLSLPHPAGCPPLTLSPQKQKEKTLEALVGWLVEEAEKAAVYSAWEDLHWADPSTLELLHLFLDHVPTASLLVLLTCRPDYRLSWGSRSYLTQLTLGRLGHTQVEMMIKTVTGGKSLPAEVVQQIVSKTDGVPLFVEELTKMVLESGLLSEGEDHYKLTGPLPALSIPSTLQDSLMARLDRLAPVREIAQVGATLGREFSYGLIHAVSPLDEAVLQQGLRQLVDAELIYQRGLPPQAVYFFKHALVQDTAHQSLLKSRRQQLHQQVAQVLEQQFPETIETQPELLAHHYTEASLIAQAVPYWQKAGQRAIGRFANAEAISHLTRGLELLKTSPDTPERTQQELTLQITLGMPLMNTRGYAAPEVERAYARARELCRQMGETPQLFPVLFGLWVFHFVRAELQTARELGEQFLRLAQNAQDRVLLLEAHHLLGTTLFHLGELTSAQTHFEQSIALYDPQQHRSLALLYGQDPAVVSLTYVALILWLSGSLDQALKKSHEAFTLAQDLGYPHTLAFALDLAAVLQQHNRKGQAVHERAEALSGLSTEQGFALFLARGIFFQGWALAERGRREEGIVQMRQGLATSQATGADLWQPYFLALLAEACGKIGQTEEGLTLLTEVLAAVHKTGERWCEAEVYRLVGELSLRRGERETGRAGEEEKIAHSPIHPFTHSSPEECFLKAIEIAQRQQAKSLELRATTSLARLWQQQGKRHEACNTLSEICSWFTEGLDAKDLQEAKALLQELKSSKVQPHDG
jgi:class 3 adenylate cyclase/predicted ATPase